MIHGRVVAGLALAAVLATGVNTTTSCEPTTGTAPGHTVHTTVPRHAARADGCDPGWVCGTCPDGREWGYLDDPRWTHDPVINRLLFDYRNPCG